MKFVTVSSLLILSTTYGQWQQCDQGADIVFVQDLQDSMSRPLRYIEDDIEDVMDELEEFFKRPRFGVITFVEQGGTPCVNIPVSLTRNDDSLEDAYERLRATTKASSQNYGSPFSGLLAALTWPEVQWQSSNRVIILFTNNMPLTAGAHVAASAERAYGCHRAIESPQENTMITQLKESKATVLFVIPDASTAVSTYWNQFNAKLGQPASLVTSQVRNLDDWIEHKRYFFTQLKAQNCGRSAKVHNVTELLTTTQTHK